MATAGVTAELSAALFFLRHNFDANPNGVILKHLHVLKEALEELALRNDSLLQIVDDFPAIVIFAEASSKVKKDQTIFLMYYDIMWIIIEYLRTPGRVSSSFDVLDSVITFMTSRQLRPQFTAMSTLEREDELRFVEVVFASESYKAIRGIPRLQELFSRAVDLIRAPVKKESSEDSFTKEESGKDSYMTKVISIFVEGILNPKISSSVMELFINVGTSAPKEVFVALNELLGKLDPKRWDIPLVLAFFNLTSEVVDNRGREILVPNDSLAILWHVMLDTAATPWHVKAEAVSYCLQLILDYGRSAPCFLEFYNLFIRNIKNDMSTTASIYVFDQVIDNLPSKGLSSSEAKKVDFKSRKELTIALEQTHSLLSLLINELMRYKNAVVPVMKECLARASSEDDVMYQFLHPASQTFHHERSLKYRFDFIFRVLWRLGPTKSFDIATADNLCSHFFFSSDPKFPILREERSMFTNTLRIALFPILEKGQPGLSPEVARHLFTKWFMRPEFLDDAVKWRANNIFNFGVFFLCINIDKIKILRTDHADMEVEYEVEEDIDHLHGFAELWKIFEAIETWSGIELGLSLLSGAYVRGKRSPKFQEKLKSVVERLRRVVEISAVDEAAKNKLEQLSKVLL